MLPSGKVKVTKQRLCKRRQHTKCTEKIIQLNEGMIKQELKDLVRTSVEETINGLLDEETKSLTNAEKYERTQDRQGYRAGHYERDFQTTSGNVKLKMPKLKGSHLKQRLLNDTNGASPRWRKP